ncbi:RNA pseudouridine synthase [Paraneptunicella aestuarii]|uniref:pseudouridine synthase n=1 Tax=Paraneptunicella aestuarii TaxID=2831148 RepID=UPI001E38E255|nr:pseudouridine synthase [Paraneptunicella aestuarii]UAA38102.1 RNA pseudouridine synthase [Paraneptunicella aestuarii]
MAILNYQPPTNPYIKVVYQDDHVLVLDKPSGLLTVPGKALEHRDCLQLRVQRVFPEARIVHRLDMATSGLIVMAFGKSNQGAIGKQFEQRQVDKTYQALVWEHIEDDSGTVSLPLICDWPNRPKQMVDHERGKPATTHWQVKSRNLENNVSLKKNIPFSLVELKPVTGRSHQLRVHMLSLGHPILGDRLYAHEQALAARPRLQLHACQLSFKHPQTDVQLNFESPPPFNI